MRGVLLQVRLDSTRLPGKALLKLNDFTIIEHAMRSLKQVHADYHILVTTKDSYLKLKPYAEKWGFEIFQGSKENVLERFIKAIDYYKLTEIVRATGDNPLVSHEMANLLIEFHTKHKNDYSGYLNSPVGTGVEVVNVKALYQAYNKSKDSYDLEHVTPYLYKNPNKFKVFQGDAPQKYLLLNSFVTIDTPQDFKRIEKLFHELYHGSIIPLESVIKWLKREQLSYTPILGKKPEPVI